MFRQRSSIQGQKTGKMELMMRLPLFACVALCLMSLPLMAHAQSSEQDEVYRAFSTGRILGLNDIRDRVSSRVAGKLISTELDEGEARRGRYVYRLTFLQDTGAVVRVAVDAASGRILQMDGQ
jgi:uncharacterized membrane protein YkoI